MLDAIFSLHSPKALAYFSSTGPMLQKMLDLHLLGGILRDPLRSLLDPACGGELNRFFLNKVEATWLFCRICGRPFEVVVGLVSP